MIYSKRYKGVISGMTMRSLPNMKLKENLV